MTQQSFRITPVRSPRDLAATRGLFEDYARALAIDLTYQNFAEELSDLAGKYAPPHGELLLARDRNDAAVGCVALRRLVTGICEMKRLYVAPAGRGLGLGEALVRAGIETACNADYQEMRLDTLPNLTQAISLYRKLGFTQIGAYYDTPITETLFWSKALTRRC